MLGDEGSGVRGFALGSFSQHNVFPRSFFHKKWSIFGRGRLLRRGLFFIFGLGARRTGGFLRG